MNEFKVTKTAEFDYGHRIPQHDSKCRNVHGHRGKIEVTVTGCLATTGSSTGMVMDFSTIKGIIQQEIVERLDHVMIIAEEDTELFKRLSITDKSVATQIDDNVFGLRYFVQDFGIVQFLKTGVPTAEILAYACFQALALALPAHCHLSSVRFWETPNSVAEYPAEQTGISTGEYRAYVNAQSA